jgi:CheY-like chemotaxis protein
MGAQSTGSWVLVVNDDEEIGMLLALLCEELDLCSLVVGSAQAARDALDRYPWRLIITDSLASPGEPWVWVDELQARLAALRCTLSHAPAPVLLVSAHVPTVLERHHEHGVAAVLPAPFDMDDLTAVVATLLDPRT